MKTVDALVNAPMGVQELVLQKYGYEITGNRHVECPFCSQKKKFRLSFSEKIGGQYGGICVCGVYPLIKLAEHRSGKQGKEFLDELDELIGNTPTVIPQNHNEQTPEQKAWALFNSGCQIKGTPAQDYLKSRGINILPRFSSCYIESMRFDYQDEGGAWKHRSDYGAIYTILTNEAGKAVKEHITYLNGSQKAPEQSARKLRTVSQYGSSISAKIYDGRDVMGVGEGFESCLAYTQLKKVPTLPAMNTANLKNFRCSDYVKTLHIATDHDHNGAGLAAAMVCANANILQRPNLDFVYVDMPQTKGFDFNDALIHGDQIVRITVCKK